MRIKYNYLLIALFLPFLSLSAQTTKEEVMKNILQAGSTYYSYPTPTGKLTPAPKGYKPFYISHYGRHGSRYITSSKYYINAISVMNSADSLGKLTGYGKDVLKRLNTAYADAYLRDGDLSKLGGRQHRAIANRMYRNFPEVFLPGTPIDAKSSTVMRCAISMSNFCLALQGLNPKLDISMETSKRNMWYIANDADDSIPKSPADKEIDKRYNEYRVSMFHTSRLMSKLFTDASYVKDHVDAYKLMRGLWNIAEDMQCQPELKLSFFDLFTNDELFDIWQSDNAGWYYWIGLFPGSTPQYKGHYGLLRNILDTADKAIRNNGNSVTLRFGHDSILTPLAFLLHLKGCDTITDDMDNLYKYWANFKITPMGGNIQMIFYRKSGSNDVLVKFLLNEHETSIPVKTDVAPYYHWKDVETFYRTELAK
jgi:hypothetical protein